MTTDKIGDVSKEKIRVSIPKYIDTYAVETYKVFENENGEMVFDRFRQTLGMPGKTWLQV